MDLLSLPKEMLASVLKYVKFDHLLEIRRISTAIDSTARKYGLPNLILDELSISADQDGSIMVQLIPELDSFIRIRINIEGNPPYESFDFEEPKPITKIHMNEPLAQIVQFYFPKIHRVKFLLVLGYLEPNHVIINEEVAKVILKYGKLNIKWLYFHHCELQFDNELLRGILTSFPVERLSLRLYINSMHHPFKDELYDGLQFDELTLECLSPGIVPVTSINCLHQICSKKLPAKLSIYRLNVTVLELGEFLERHVIDSFDTKIFYWSFTVKPDQMNKEQAKRYLMNLECLRTYKVNFKETGSFFNPTLRFSVLDSTQDKQDPFLEIFVKYEII